MIKFFLCSSVMFILVNLGITHADEHFPLLGQVKHGPVNIRSGANTNFEVIFKLTQGDQCVVLGKNFEWYKIQAPQLAEAYIRADYIKELEGGRGELIGDKVNVRSKPKPESSPLCQLLKGEFVKLIQKKDNWWKIEPPISAIGWVHGDFIVLSREAIPAALLRQAIGSEIQKDPQVLVPIEKPQFAMPIVKVEGIIRPLTNAAAKNVHYEVFVNEKPVYLLKDVLYLELFKNMKVKIEAVTNNEENNLKYPLLHIKEISILL